jgi:hypothetical protein
MSLPRLWLLSALLSALSVALWAAPVAAAERVGGLATKLRASDDFRVRTQAALALGASGSDKAVDPLCKGLDDGNDTVRAAAAAALGKLGRGGKKCLERRLGREPSANVRKMIKKAIGLVAEAEAGPALSAGTRYYISIGKTALDGANDSKLDEKVRTSLRRAASSYRGYVFAPAGETAALAKKRLRKHPQVIGFALAPRVIVEHEGRTLTVKLLLLIGEYPEGGSMGRIMREGGFPGVSDDMVKDKQGELVARLCTEAMREFDQLAGQLD